ncbi:hypothetical protein HYALB_00011710 [Hymenoscyphus albidus]|uniref:Uncharacterized protein n=1 Tax=Hymenoscyphus albidus TaxID=595503 RepID=A0A9N9LQM6_9HELO|nr:hypothetical protein HYALB_00011710 [Hymenoscyphus albidus]
MTSKIKKFIGLHKRRYEGLLENAVRLSDTGGLLVEKKKAEQIKERFDKLEDTMIGLVQKLRRLTDHVKKDLLGEQ